MKVKEIMSKDIACIGLEDSVQRAAELMKQYDVGSLPVCQDEQIVGIVTDRDIALRSVAEGSTEKKVKDIMTPDPVVGEPDMNVHDAAQIMSREQIRRLPIVYHGSLVGIVSLGDISLEPQLQNEAEDALQSISDPGGPSMQ